MASTQAFFNPSQLSNSGFQAVTFPFREGQLIILGWISLPIVLRFLPRRSATKPLLPFPVGSPPCAPHSILLLLGGCV